MMRHRSLEHRFVRNTPRELEPGVLYISMEYATAVHSCCCGCGERVVTPFTPTDWRMTFDGESVTLNPSVGNWNQDCRSHYVIERNRVIESGPWSDAQVEAERRRDKRVKAEYYNRASAPARLDAPSTGPASGAQQASGPWSRFWAWFLK
ncbi:DUF6527 family protein [Aquabacterium sp.]|uniref:DUF6527 family protein n=1 Tax=Aquabacterium sp. TaxID=1872578 RepID=UPI003D08CC3E